MGILLLLLLLVATLDISQGSLLLTNELVYLPGHKVSSHVKSPLPYTYLNASDLPPNFRWDNVDNKSYITKSLNQHVPQWCGSCWAHGALSSFADRIKIDRQAAADDIHLSIQYVLNCGADIAGSCRGGSLTGTYQFIFEKGFIPYDTCQAYIACSNDSDVGFCAHVDTTCSAFNTCRTCTIHLEPSLHPVKRMCRQIDVFPNATIAEFGVLQDNNVHHIQAEIFARGPVAAEIRGIELHTYQGGVYRNKSASQVTTHVVSIIGWETDPITHKQAWICRNSWGQYWGEMGFFRIEAGSNILGIESHVAWATPGQYTVSNYPCDEGGENCRSTTAWYCTDPSQQVAQVQRRLRALKSRRE